MFNQPSLFESLSFTISVAQLPLLCCIALDKALFSTKKYLYFSYFSTKTYVEGTHQKRLTERGTSNEYPQHMFSSRNKKTSYLILHSYLDLC